MEKTIEESTNLNESKVLKKWIGTVSNPGQIINDLDALSYALPMLLIAKQEQSEILTRDEYTQTIDDVINTMAYLIKTLTDIQHELL